MSTSKALAPTGKPATTVNRKTVFGPTLHKVKDAFCEDGKRRTVTITGQPGTYFSVPGRISYKGKTVTGEVGVTNQENGATDYIFYARGKYEYLLSGDQPATTQE